MHVIVLPMVRWMCLANAGNFWFLSASSKCDAMRLGAGGVPCRDSLLELPLSF